MADIAISRGIPTTMHTAATYGSSRRKQTFGMMAALLATVAWGLPASAQDSTTEVLMRRPLPDLPSSSGTPSSTTPTPTPTPTPGATPTSGVPSSTPTPTPSATPDPGSDASGNFSAYVAGTNCVDGQIQFDCFRGDFENGGEVGGEDGVDESFCAAQAKNAQWSAAAGGNNAIIPSEVPAAYATAGQACTSGTIGRTAIGGTCASDGSISCSSVQYQYDPSSSGVTWYTTTDNPVTAIAASNCETDQGTNEYDRRALAAFSLLPASTGFVAQCKHPDVYGAKGACTTKVTYDAGWPQTGSAHVNAGYEVQCFAVYNAGDPVYATVVQTDVSNCVDQHPTPAQEAMLAKLAPAMVDYQALDQTCSATGDLKREYERYEPYSNGDGTPYESVPGINEGINLTHQYEQTVSSSDYENQDDPFSPTTYTYSFTFDQPYVCTDVDNYFFGGTDSAFLDSFSMGDSPCKEQHAADVSALQNAVDLTNQESIEDGQRSGYADPEQWRFTGGYQPQTVSFTDDAANQVIHWKFDHAMVNNCDMGWEDPAGLCK